VFDEAGGDEDMEAAGREMNAELALLLGHAQAEGAIRGGIGLADVHAIAAAVLAMDTHAAADDADRAATGMAVRCQTGPGSPLA